MASKSLQPQASRERWNELLRAVGFALVALAWCAAPYALPSGWFEPAWGAAVALLPGNAVFNFYPVLLQRYKRARLTSGAVRCG